MRWRSYAIVLTIAALAIGVRADGQEIPKGSYQQSCVGIQIRFDILIARCKTAKSDLKGTVLEDYASCRGDIANDNGKLRCVGGSEQGVASPQAPSDEAAELTRLVKEFLAGATRNDAAVHDRFWADDLIYTGSSGKRRSKAEVMKDVRSAPPPKEGDPSMVFTSEDVRVQVYGDAAIVAFRLVGTSSDGTVSNFFNTGTFVKRAGEWRAVAWQATKIPE